jgi:hypothetical protein
LTCPNTEFCDDPFPANPSKKVKQLYEKYHDLCCDSNLPRHETSGEPKGLPFVLMQLCLAIAADKTFRNVEKDSHNWPKEIDFMQLHKRVLDLNKNGEIQSLLASSIVLHVAVAWRSLLDKVSSATISKTVKGQTVECGLTFQKWTKMEYMKKFDTAGGDSAG